MGTYLQFSNLMKRFKILSAPSLSLSLDVVNDVMTLVSWNGIEGR
jgi:hypothetical protein